MMSDYIHSLTMNFYWLFINYFALALSNINTTVTTTPRSLRNRRLEVIGAETNGARKRDTGGEGGAYRRGP